MNNKSNKTGKRKAGRKAQWPESLLNDVIDIITNSEYYWRKLIFTNTKNQKNAVIYQKILEELKKRAAVRNEDVKFTPVQIRTKFKKAVAECKKAALTMKSGSGIKRFQEERGYGASFHQLFSLVKTRDSCQPEQAIEPDNEVSYIEDNSSISELAATSSTSSESPAFFLPTKKTSKVKARKDAIFNDMLEIMKTVVNNDPIRNYLEYATEEAERNRQYEFQLVQMLMHHESPQLQNYKQFQMSQ